MIEVLDDRTFTRARPTLVDQDAIYVTGEDHLRLTTFNGLAGVIVALEGRFMDLAGRVTPLVERHIPNTDRTAATSLVTLGEGFLCNVQVRATTGSPQSGQCYAIVELVRGRTGAIQPLATLLGGYVSDVQRLAWPGSPIISSVQGTGIVRAFGGTDPAAGVEISETVPTGARWRLYSFFATLVTSAVVNNRTVTLIIDDGVNTLWTCDASAAQAATLTRNYEAYTTGVAPDLTGSTFRLPAPFPMDLVAGSRIRTSTALLDVGDNWSAPRLMVEERIAG
jgi:hypothetical protein